MSAARSPVPMPFAPEAPMFQPAPKPHRTRADAFRDALFWIMIGAMALASLTLLVSINSIISIWFREQWAPVARAVASAAIIVGCAWGLARLVRRGPAAR